MATKTKPPFADGDAHKTAETAMKVGVDAAQKGIETAVQLA